MSDKKIAKIYYDAHVFLTKTGELYGYTIQSNGKPRCDRLSAQQKIAFWEGRRVYEEPKSYRLEPGCQCRRTDAVCGSKIYAEPGALI